MSWKLIEFYSNAYVPAIVRLVPDEMVQTFSVFMEFCYLACRSVSTDKSLAQLESAIEAFHHHRQVFVREGVRPDGFFSLLHQHAADHYPEHIQDFCVPNGLCSSITECMHIKAVAGKEPWRRSNRFDALGQMLQVLTNQ